jgi:hypothetical protein
MKAIDGNEDRARAALIEAGLAGAFIATGCRHLSNHQDLERYFAHQVLDDPEAVPQQAWGTTISWLGNRIGRYDLVRLNRGDIERWLASAHRNEHPRAEDSSPLPLEGRKSKSKKKPSLNDRKRAAVLGAFEALGRENLGKLTQKEREARVIATVADKHDNLSVSDRYVRGLWNSHEERSNVP